MASILVRLGVALLVTSALVVGASPVAAQSGDQPAWADDLFEDLEGMQSQFNDNIGDTEMSFAEQRVYNQIKGNVVNVYFAGTDVVFSFRMRSDGTITELRQSPRDDASLKMLMTRETAEELAARDSPVPGFVENVRTGERTGDSVEGIVITGEDGELVKRVTWGIINVFKGFV